MSASQSNPIALRPPTNTANVPVLGEGFQEAPSRPTANSADSSDEEVGSAGVTAKGAKQKRRLFGLGKKKDEDKTKTLKKKGDTIPVTMAGNDTIAQPPARSVENPSPSRSHRNHPYQLPASPQRGLYNSSPRIVSPAGSQIFERDVQEATLPVPNSPAIPSHIQTENRIPPVLDASSQAITNTKLDPDNVEIVMHASHQPAAASVTGTTSIESSTGGLWADDLVAHPDKDDAVSNYGALDSTDVRRLSFISFQDIVQSEHMEHTGNRDSIYMAGLSSFSSGHNRSPSPIRSPVSSQGLGTSPPTSNPASIKGTEASPRKPVGGPLNMPLVGGELTIETMSQALRRTHSGDLSGVRSQPLSPSSPDGLSDKSFR